jgi:microcompartment protein CcmL/EutN
MMMKNEALGMIETYGYIGAIEAADVCVKSANVKLLGCEFVRGGLVTIHITGDVGAVKASIDAAEAAVKKVGSLISSHVIPRPGEGIEKILPVGENENSNEEDIKEEVKEEKEVNEDSKLQDKIEPEEKKEQNQESQKESNKEEKSNEDNSSFDIKIYTKEELKNIKTVKLRTIARELDGKYSDFFPIERNKIKYSKKNELISAILKFYERVK